MIRTAPARRFSSEEIGWHLSDAYLERHRRRQAAAAAAPHAGAGLPARSAQAVPAPQPPGIVKIKEIVATIEDLRVTTLPGKAIVQAVIVEQIFFVGPSGVVQERVVRSPFAHPVELPGLDPDKIADGTQVLDVTAEVEFVIAHLVDPTRVKDKIVVALTLTLTEKRVIDGIPLDVVILTKREQVLVVVIKEFPVKQVQVAEIPQPGFLFQQVLLEEKKRLEAIKIKRVEAETRDVSAQTLPGKVIVSGVVRKQVQFVGPDNIVRVVQEDIPFTHVKEVAGATPAVPVQVGAEVEFVIPHLDAARGILTQKIVLRLRLIIPDRRTVQVVTDVVGPGIVTDKVLIRVDGVELAVVTDVRGPGIRRVVKDTILADVVDDGDPNPVPIVVVVDVELDPDP